MTIIIVAMQSCSNFGAGFGGYEKPSKNSSKYYTSNFKLTNPKLKVAHRYADLDNKGLNANNANEYSYFVFFENGFVLHNSDYKRDDNNNLTSLDYSDIYSEDVGSYLIRGDTIFWGTRPGYQRKKMAAYYTALISDSGLTVISSQFDKVKFFTAYH
jgi:hypothetical protein